MLTRIFAVDPAEQLLLLPERETPRPEKAVSKACSDQATAKGLHGKERKIFRSACKRNGGKAA
jgi:hypothetical protein